MKVKNYFIIYEIENRDFIQRMLISLELASKGNRVFLVSKYFFYKNFKYFPVGMVLDKGITNNEVQEQKKILDKKFLLSVIDEEGARYYDNEPNFIDIRISKKTSKRISHFFCWGKKQKTKIKFINENKISISGSPKYDLYNKDLDLIYESQKKIIKKLKPYILISSNFVYATYKNKDFKKKIELLRKEDESKNKLSFWNNYIKKYNFKKKVLNLFIGDLIKLSNRFKKLNFILRPHPNDDQSFWLNKFKKNKNLKILSDFSIEPWIKECECLLSNNCTTTIEASLIEKKTINYSPIKRKKEKYFFNDLSYNVKSIKKLIEIIKIKKKIHKKKLKRFNDYIYFDPNKKSYKIISDKLNTFKFEKKLFSLLERKRLSLIYFINKFVDLIRRKTINQKLLNRKPEYYYDIKSKIDKIYPKYSSINFNSINEQLYIFEQKLNNKF